MQHCDFVLGNLTTLDIIFSNRGLEIASVRFSDSDYVKHTRRQSKHKILTHGAAGQLALK